MERAANTRMFVKGPIAFTAIRYADGSKALYGEVKSGVYCTGPRRPEYGTMIAGDASDRLSNLYDKWLKNPLSIKLLERVVAF